MNVWRLPLCCSAMNHPPTGEDSGKDNRLCAVGSNFSLPELSPAGRCGAGGVQRECRTRAVRSSNRFLGSGGSFAVASIELANQVGAQAQSGSQAARRALAQRLPVWPLQDIGADPIISEDTNFRSQTTAENAPAGIVRRGWSDHDASAPKQGRRQQTGRLPHCIHGY